MNNPTVWMAAVLFVACILYSLTLYLYRSSFFKKGEYGRHFVNKTLKRHASPRGMTVLSDVTIGDGEETISFDHVLLGYFGVLFIQSIQGSGSFWGDGKQDIWAFSDEKNNSKLLFKNPLNEMDHKLKVFRRVLSKNKQYNVPVHSAVVIVTLGEAPKMYLSNLGGNDCILLDSEFASFLRKDTFEQDNGVDPDSISKLFSDK